MPNSLIRRCLFIPGHTAPLISAQVAGTGAPVLPGEVCQIAPQAGWTEAEQWVWDQVCTGKMADFNAVPGYGGELAPGDPENWPANRILRPEFIETILMYEPYRSALTFKGVRIEGAWFRDRIALSDATLGHSLLLHSSRFESDVNLQRLRTPHLLSFLGSAFYMALDMDSLQVDGSLSMRDAHFANVILRGARIRDQLNMDGATFSGDLNMDSVQVGTNLFMRQSRFAGVNLRGARIEEQLEMDGSNFSGKLNGIPVTSSSTPPALAPVWPPF